MERARVEGMAAFNEGAPLLRNPYTIGSTQRAKHNAWNEGWWSAEEDHQLTRLRQENRLALYEKSPAPLNTARRVDFQRRRLQLTTQKGE